MTITNDWLFALTLVTALGSGLIAGVFFGFSTFIMKGLGRISPAEGISAMQSMNLTVINPVFMLVFLGTALTSLATIIAAITRWQEPYAIFLLAGGLLYLVGSFVVTMIFNVPKNNALAAITPTEPESARFWTSYLTRWTAWNHVRLVGALAAMASLIIALTY